MYCCWPGSSVGIATEYGLDGPRSNPDGDEIFCPSRPALGPTQPAIKWVPALSREWRRPGRGADPHPHLVCRGPRKSRAIPLLNLGVFVAFKNGRNLPIYIYCYQFSDSRSWRFHTTKTKALHVNAPRTTTIHGRIPNTVQSSILSFRRVLYVVCFLLGISPASEV